MFIVATGIKGPTNHDAIIRSRKLHKASNLDINGKRSSDSADA